MKHNFLKLTAFILTISLFLTGCGYGSTLDVDDTHEPSSDEDTDVYDGDHSVTSIDGIVTNPVDDVFTLCWLREDSLNPFKNLTGENSAVSSLMYEGLFTISPDFVAEPCLCSDYSVSDLTYTFNIKSGITFHDGAPLSAYDVEYSISHAMGSERYSSRLQCIESIVALDEDTVEITVIRENYTLPILLDVPIVSRWTANDSIPNGTGPYTYVRGSDEVGPHLTAYAGYRESVPVSDIYLYDVNEVRPSIAMSQNEVDFILHLPLEETLDVCIDHAAYHYETTILQYIGFDTNDPILGNSEVRRAISHLIDRDVIVSDIMDNNVTAAPLALSPSAPGYDDMSETISEPSVQTFSAILSSKGAVDSDGDGWLELNGETMSFTFIVSETDDYKVNAAKKVVSFMSGMGIKIDLKILPYIDYVEALEHGYFDMYYGEVRLPANFDLTQILASYGDLNYGGCSKYNEVLENYLAAETETEKNTAAKNLCRTIYENAPIIPICYNRLAVVSPRSLIQGVDPSQQYLFWGLSNWTIDLDKEDQT